MQRGTATVALAALAALVALAARAGAAPPPMDDDMRELAAALRSGCQAETGVDLALVERVNAGEPLMDDAALKCYTRCVMETAGMLADGAVDLDVVLALLDERTRAANEAGLRACGTRAGSDACDTAWRTQRCWQATNPADYFLI